ncbi:MAG: redoxin domain-containing protein [Deltaproteobacteria bacterium]|nr:redoxin domain-containing protein [Deltaproteobacteria bacterium]
MRDSWPEFERRSATVAVVAPGSRAGTSQLCDRHRIPFRCLADPDGEAYRAFGLQRGTIAQIMGPDVMLKTMRSFFRGNFGPPGGDVFQLGGTFVIGQDGVVKLAHAARDPSDLLATDAILAHL